MKFEIKHRFSGEILCSVEAESWKLAIEGAIKQKADLSSANLSYANLMVFQCQQHWAHYTFDGALRIGCLLMPVTEWALGFKEIGKKEGYSEEQIKMYGMFINMCLEHFKERNP